MVILHTWSHTCTILYYSYIHYKKIITLNLIPLSDVNYLTNRAISTHMYSRSGSSASDREEPKYI